MTQSRAEGPADPLVNVYRLLSSIHAERNLDRKMQAIVEAVVDSVGFELAALNVVRPTGEFEVVAVAGGQDARQELLGAIIPALAFDAEFAASEQWGLLRFVPHERSPAAYPGSWVPDFVPGPAVDSWHPLDALIAPLSTSDGELIGVLSVDLPRDGLHPSLQQRSLLEILATEAAVAIHNGMLSEQVRVSEEIFRQAFDGSPGGMALIGIEKGRMARFTRVNPALHSILGFSQEQLLETTEQMLTHFDDLASDEARLDDLLAGRIPSYRREKRLRHRNGGFVWVAVTSTITRHRDGSPRIGVCQIEDISAKKTEMETLQFQATHDSLTQLPHRPAVLTRLNASIDRARANERPGALLFLDLNDFKLVNDRYGHAVGDSVLTILAGRIVSAAREHDLVGRLGGDEFVVVADDLSQAQARSLAERVRAAVAVPFTEESELIEVTVSVGISEIGTGPSDAAQILRDADEAMYRRKKESGSHTTGNR